MPNEKIVCPFCGIEYKTQVGLAKHLKRCPARPDAEEPDVEASPGEGIPIFEPKQKANTVIPHDESEPDVDEDGNPYHHDYDPVDGDEDEDDIDDDEYICPECGYSRPKPFARCPKCGEMLEW